MTEKTLKHEVYKHGSYLYSLKEAGSQFVNIDDEIDKFDELFELVKDSEYNYNELKALYDQMCQANVQLLQKDQPAFKVGEYYSCGEYIFRVKTVFGFALEVVAFNSFDPVFTECQWPFSCLENSKPATAEQIAMFKRAEQFAKHGRKLDEFDLCDQVLDPLHGTGSVVAVDSAGDITVRYDYSCESVEHRYTRHTCVQLDLIRTAEELQEVAVKSLFKNGRNE